MSTGVPVSPGVFLHSKFQKQKSHFCCSDPEDVEAQNGCHLTKARFNSCCGAGVNFVSCIDPAHRIHVWYINIPTLPKTNGWIPKMMGLGKGNGTL